MPKPLAKNRRLFACLLGHTHACTHTHVRTKAHPCTGAAYILGKDGSNACPSGSTAVPKADCVAAAVAAGKATPGRTIPAHLKLTQGAWGWTPSGCFVHTAAGHPAISPHFSTGGANNNGDYQKVCQKGTAGAAPMRCYRSDTQASGVGFDPRRFWVSARLKPGGCGFQTL